MTSALPTGGHHSPDLRALALATLQPGFVGLTPPEWVLRELDAGLGGVALFARNILDLEQVARLTGRIHAANPRALVAVDEEAGDVTRLEYSTGSSWPGNLALGAVDDLAVTESVGREIGTMLDDVGIDLDYAPDADVNSNPDNPVIGVRSFGSDPALVARHTAAWVRGLQSAGVLACAKHFPGHGNTAVDSHVGLPETDFTGPDDVALQPFRAAIEAGAASVMSAHILVRGLDDRPATLSRRVLVDLLRDELGFSGLAISDGMEMGAITGSMDIGEGCVRAIAAGVDALCIGGGLAGEDTVQHVASALVDAVHEGRLEEARLVEAAQQVARAADERSRLRQRASTVRHDDPAPDLAGTTAGAHNAAGLEAARRAIHVRGPVPALVTPEAPAVVELMAPNNFAVGDETLSGIAAAVRRRWPGTKTIRVSSETQLVDAATAAREQPLWVIVRDPHRHHWMATGLDDVLAARPDAVVLDTGWPGWSAPMGTLHVVTHGAARVTAECVVDRLAGPPGQPPTHPTDTPPTG